jgi:hypothetical protein
VDEVTQLSINGIGLGTRFEGFPVGRVETILNANNTHTELPIWEIDKTATLTKDGRDWRVLYVTVFVENLKDWMSGEGILGRTTISNGIGSVSVNVGLEYFNTEILPTLDLRATGPRFSSITRASSTGANAIRAPDILARHLLENFHPLALARVLCPRESFEEFARQVLLDSRYPLFPVSPKSDPAAVAAEQWFRDAAMNAVEKYVASAGLQPVGLTAPPLPAEPANRSYCARCGAQFVMTEGSCADCGGRPLQPFK